MTTARQQPAAASDGEAAGDEIVSMRESLKEAEHQNQLINAEYGKLLREKEVRIFN